MGSLSSMLMQSYSDDAVPIRWQCPTAVQTRVYTAKSDVYSFGVLLWELFSNGATPFGDMTASEAFRAVCAGHRLPWPRSSTHEDIVQLIRDTTASDVQTRPVMAAVHRTLGALLETTTQARAPATEVPVVTSFHMTNPVLNLDRYAWGPDDEEETETTEL